LGARLRSDHRRALLPHPPRSRRRPPGNLTTQPEPLFR
jgi:hypothetical protein